jgi:hypothetical protein
LEKLLAQRREEKRREEKRRERKRVENIFCPLTRTCCGFSGRLRKCVVKD